jgi:MATE family multidrug resistance protein
MGIYFDRCRYICIVFWGGVALFHYFFARSILEFCKVKERVIDLTLEFISISVFSALINVNFYINQKHFTLIDKSKMNFYISIFSLIIQTILGYLLVVVFKFGVRGSALSYFFAACFNSLVSTIILTKMNLPEGSLVFFTKDGLKDWKNYLDIALPGILVSGGDWMGYEFQSIFAIKISDIDYSSHVILINLENLCYPFTVAITSAISMKSGEKLMKLNPEQLKTYIKMSYLFNFLLLIIVISLLLKYGDYYFNIISPNDEIYLKCSKIIYTLSYFVFADNAYYFFLGCLKGFGYIRNTTIATLVVFFGIGPLLIKILAFIYKMGVKGIWASTSIALTMGSLLFIYWIFSFDLKRMRELAEERIRKDNENIYNIIGKKILMAPIKVIKFLEIIIN